MVDTFDNAAAWSWRLPDALVGGVDHDVASGVCESGRAPGSEYPGVVPAVWRESRDGLHLVSSGRPDRPARSLASTGPFPRRTPAAIEQTVLELRAAHPAWGVRKLAAVLRARG